MNIINHAVRCPECGSPMELKKTSRYLHKDGSLRKFYSCTKFPDCRGTHGAHPDGRPLGEPATHEVKQLRIKAHRLLERRFGKWNEISPRQKRIMYEWIRKNTTSGHIAKMDKSELEEFILII